MTTHILYYSLTGVTEAVCKTLQAELGAHLHRIEAPAFRLKGKLGIFLYGGQSLLGLKRRISVPDVAMGPDDLLILAAPVWTANTALPMRTWLSRRPALPERVALVMTSGDPAFPDAAFQKFEAGLGGRAPAARLHVPMDLANDPAQAAEVRRRIAEFQEALGQAT